MTLTAALFVYLLALQPAAPPSNEQGIRCIYDTVGMDRMQSYNAQIEAGTLSIQQFAAATAADRRTCIQRGAWQHQSQIDSSFAFALSMAELVDAGKELQAGGINPDDVLGKWDVMPSALRAALKAGITDYRGGNDKFVADLRSFLTSQTPANRAPYLGEAGRLFSAYGEMLRLADEYGAAGSAVTP